MRNDLLFHITTKANWDEHKNDGNYEPESLEAEGFIHCSTGDQIEETANRIYTDKDKILLLVIDASLVGEENIKYEKDEDLGVTYPHIYSPLNINAIIDKIEIKSENDGKFNISFSTN